MHIIINGSEAYFRVRYRVYVQIIHTVHSKREITRLHRLDVKDMISRIGIHHKSPALLLVRQSLHLSPDQFSHLDIISRSFRSITPGRSAKCFACPVRLAYSRRFLAMLAATSELSLLLSGAVLICSNLTCNPASYGSGILHCGQASLMAYHPALSAGS
jgi:hypothetical protein